MEKSADDKSNTEGNLADNDKSDDKFQINITQADIDFYNMDFRKADRTNAWSA